MNLLEACKAKQTYAEVQTEAGPQRIPVPATTADVFASPHREQWLAADMKAFNILLTGTGNFLRR